VGRVGLARGPRGRRMVTRPTAIWAPLLTGGWLVVSGLVPLSSRAQTPLADWPVTEAAPGGGRHSPLVEITPGNVSRLRVAWTYRHGDFWNVVEGRLFFTTLNASSEVKQRISRARVLGARDSA